MVYSNPDEALWAYFVVNSAKLPVLSADVTHNAITRILSWDYGWPLFIIHFLWVRTLNALHIAIHEGTIVVPNVLAGTAVCLLTFFVGRAIKDRRAGLLAAAFMAVAQLPVMNSRSMGRAVSLGSVFFLFAALMLIQYIQKPDDNRRRLYAGISVGLYLCSDLQFPIGAAVLVLLMLLWPRPEGWRNPRKLARMFVRPRFLLPPVILFLPYVAAYLYARSLGYPEQTYLGSILVEHSYDWGIHLIPWLRDLGSNVGPVLTGVSLISVVLLFTRWHDRRYRWLLSWIAVTAAPFLFAVTWKVTIAAGYHVHLVVGLAIAAGIGVSMLKRPWLIGLVAALIVGSTVFVTCRAVLGISVPDEVRSSRPIPYGGIPPDSGVKAAGYWVRQHVPPSARIHVIHDPAVAHWYMGREAAQLDYTRWPQYREYLAQHADELDVVVVPETTASWENLELPARGFEGLVTIVDGGRVACRIATRWPVEETLQLDRTNTRYNRTYNSIDTILPEVGPYVPGKPLTLPGQRPD
ncbi:MAG: hypothetical protein R6V19_15930 [Armatimonadota bacterium]